MSGQTEPPPPDLDQRGLSLWAEVAATRALGPGERVLLHEACRTVDRLDRLASIISGEDEPWARVVLPDHSDLMRLEVTSAVAEARLQQQALRATLTSLGLERSPGGTAPASDPDAEKTRDPVDEFTRARATRRRTGAKGT